MRPVTGTPAATVVPGAAGANWVVDDRLRWVILALLVAGFAFPSLPAGFIFDPAVQAALTASGNAGGLLRKMWLPPIALALVVIWMRARLLVWMLPELNKALLAMLLWCTLSSAWSPEPMTTFKQAFALCGATLVGVTYLLASWQSGGWERDVRLIVLAMCLLSIAVVAVRPDIGVHGEDQFELKGSWRGITYQKNGLGQLTAVGVILWVHAIAARQVALKWALPALLVCIYVLLRSRSSTSLLLSVLVGGLVWLRLRPAVSFQGRLGTLVLGGVLLLAFPFYLYVVIMGGFDYDTLAQPFAQMFGKDATFSGRTLIWAQMMKQIQLHPLQGIGLNAFWGGPGSPADAIRRALRWDVPSGHSGYLDLTNELGLVGLAGFVAFITLHLRDCARLSQVDPASATLHMALIVYLMMANLTESGWFRPVSFTHMLAAYSSFTVSRMLFEQRLSAIRSCQTATNA